MKKLHKIFEELDINDLAKTNKIHDNVYHDILYFKRIKNFKDIKAIADLMQHFVSINSSGLLESSGRRCIRNFTNLIKIAKAILEAQ